MSGRRLSRPRRGQCGGVAEIAGGSPDAGKGVWPKRRNIEIGGLRVLFLGYCGPVSTDYPRGPWEFMVRKMNKIKGLYSPMFQLLPQPAMQEDFGRMGLTLLLATITVLIRKRIRRRCDGVPRNEVALKMLYVLPLGLDGLADGCLSGNDGRDAMTSRPSTAAFTVGIERERTRPLRRRAASPIGEEHCERKRARHYDERRFSPWAAARGGPSGHTVHMSHRSKANRTIRHD